MAQFTRYYVDSNYMIQEKKADAYSDELSELVGKVLVALEDGRINRAQAKIVLAQVLEQNLRNELLKASPWQRWSRRWSSSKASLNYHG